MRTSIRQVLATGLLAIAFALFPAPPPVQSTGGAPLVEAAAAPYSTHLVRDIAPGTASPAFTEFAALGQGLVFIADDHLWFSDGTEAGTIDLQAAVGFSRPGNLLSMGGKVYFSAVAPPPEASVQIWETKGTVADTKVAITTPGAGIVTQMIAFNGTVAYAWQGCSGGSAACTGLEPLGLRFTRGARGFLPLFGGLTDVNGSLFFVLHDAVYGADGQVHARRQLWKNGSVVGDIPGGEFNSPYDFTAIDNGVAFIANDGVNGWKVWGSNGAVIQMAPPSNDGPPGYDNPADLTNVKDSLYLIADNARGRGLFTVDDGFVTEIPYAGGTRNPRPAAQLTKVGDRLFFVVSWEQGHELWMYDTQTQGGPSLVKTIAPRPYQSVPAPSSLTAVGGLLFLAADDGVNGTELWQSDGTEAGTVMVAQIAPGSASSNPSNLIAADGKVYFIADDGAHGRELWMASLPNETCDQATDFPLVPGTDTWGSLEFAGDEDWHSVTAPATGGKMLLAMHVAGRADGGADEAATKNFDLEMYDDGCQKLAGSYNASSVEWVGRQLPMKGEERIFVNATPNTQYRTRVFGATSEDFVPPGPDSSYHMFVSFGSRINAAFGWSKITWSYDPAPQPNAPAGVLTAVVTITNRSRFEFRDLTFEVTRLSGGNVLLNRDDTGASGITSLSVPNHELCETGYPSYLCRLDADSTKGYTSFSVPFRIGLQQRRPFSFAADLYGNVVPGGTASSSDAGDLAALDGEGIQIEVTEEQLAPPEQTQTMYLPMVSK